MPIRTLDISHLDTSGAQYGANLTYVASNVRFEWVSGTYTPTPVAPGGSYSFQGTVSGYIAGGQTGSPNPFARVDNIEKFSLTSTSPSTDIAELAFANSRTQGMTSSTHGYVENGINPLVPDSGDWYFQKFPFSSDSPATVTVQSLQPNGSYSHSTASIDGYGYNSGGALAYQHMIEKVPFTSDSQGVDIGELTTTTLARRTGVSGTEYGYVLGGFPGSGTNADNTIDRFPFSSDTSATDVANLATPNYEGAGCSSTTYGYLVGGYTTTPASPNTTDNMQKFPFASSITSTNIGTLTYGTGGDGTGVSSTTHGYTIGGISPANSTYYDYIQQFSFSSDAPGGDVGEISAPRATMAGAQT